ncbi:hypothetical protein AAW51_5101 [Caldimonas brevitalea]|uniref:DUF3563 domain-containing protein n=1 Tax=Caldimonas brevitalea TaxID=413882 RepID=A0A0G3BQU9_9BURK|nr:hypothetical protein AAW51_5101 [Caldimonas brevitalea]
MLTTRPRPAAHGRLGWVAWLERFGRALHLALMDHEQRYLYNAVDLADLERRLRRLEQGDRTLWPREWL